MGASASGRRPCLVSIQSPVPFRRGEGNLALGAPIPPLLLEWIQYTPNLLVQIT